MFLLPPSYTLFPYTTLFRSLRLARRIERCRPLVFRIGGIGAREPGGRGDRKSTRLNSSHVEISYAVFCLKKKIKSNKNSDYFLNSKLSLSSFLKSLTFINFL